jgi:DNA-binding NarL/FixJ family response regulator
MDDTTPDGARYLQERSRIVHELAKVRLSQSHRSIVIIDDAKLSANALAANCRLLGDHGMAITTQSTLGDFRRDWQVQPDLIFLNDHIGRMGTGTLMLKRLVEAGLGHCVVVISPELTRSRRRQLLSLGATDALHMDELDSYAVAAILLRCFAFAMQKKSAPAVEQISPTPSKKSARI